MKIFNQVLITNDDGFESEGLILLKQILNSISQKVYTVAPMKNMSATGRSINLGKKIKFQKLSEF
jgi:Predicted acid phosphatase